MYRYSGSYRLERALSEVVILLLNMCDCFFGMLYMRILIWFLDIAHGWWHMKWRWIETWIRWRR